MFRVWLPITAVLLLARIAPAEEKKGDKVEFQSYTTPYFEKNTSGLKGDASHLVVPDKAKFDALFGIARVMGKKPPLLPDNAFDTDIALVVIKRGNAVTSYKVDGVSVADGVLHLSYTATAGKPSESARFASPLIVTVKKDGYKSVNFVENGKKVATVELAK